MYYAFYESIYKVTQPHTRLSLKMVFIEITKCKTAMSISIILISGHGNLRLECQLFRFRRKNNSLVSMTSSSKELLYMHFHFQFSVCKLHFQSYRCTLEDSTRSLKVILKRSNLKHQHTQQTTTEVEQGYTYKIYENARNIDNKLLD